MKKTSTRFWLVALLLTLPFYGYSQSKTITGTIVSKADNEGLPGVSVTKKGTNTGTLSNIEGKYGISAERGTVLVFSYIGFNTQEVTIGDQTIVNISLSENSAVLDEVVITGYGQQSRAKLTTSIAKLDTRILETSTRSNAGTALQGIVAGLRVTNTTGQPGSTPSITLRGGTNFNGSGSPLILVDGIPSSFYALNSDDIESIEVLKDAASTAIYGARAADGVILVTTKSGKVGKASVNYKYRHSLNQERNSQQFLGAADFIRFNRQSVAYQREASNRQNGFGAFLDGATGFGTGGNTTNSPFTTQFLSPENRYLLDQPGWETIVDPLNASKEILFYNNDVNDLIYQESTIQDHYVSFDGGNEKGTYYLGLGHLDNDGLILGSGFKRISGKFSGTYKITDKFRVNSNILYSHSNLSRSPLGSDDRVFRRFAGQPPTSRTYDNNPDGTLSNNLTPGTNSGFGNPLYYQDKFIRKNLEQRLSAFVGFDYDIMKDLKFSLKASHFTVNNHDERFNRSYIEGNNLRSARFAGVSLGRTLRNQLTGTVNYSKNIERHTVDVLVGGEYFKDNFFSSSAGTRFSPTDLIETLNAGSEADGIPSSFESEYLIVSNFGRLLYDFDNKYLASFTYRYDGTSRLGNNKYGFFPGVSLGWNVHEEDFFKNAFSTNIIGKIKPRLSYGVNGKVDALSNYGVFGAYGLQGVYDGQTGYANTGLPTLDLRWERSTTFNVGLDMSFLNNRISMLADYYIRDVKDKIADLTLPYWTGFSSIQTNNGTFRNRGFELQLNGDIIRNKDFSWNAGFTFFTNRSFVQSLPDNGNELNRQGGTQVFNPVTGEVEWVGGLQEGQRVGLDQVVVYGQDYIYKDQAAVEKHATREDVLLPNRFKRYPGDVAWEDINGDNVIDQLDRKVIGRTTPQFFGGFTSNITYKNFGLFVKTDFAGGHIIYNHIRGKGYAQTQGNLNQPIELLDSWTPENTVTDLPRFVFVDAQRNILRGDGGTSRNSRFWEKGDYFALREVTLSYNIPQDLTKGVFKNASIYVTGSNLHYFKSYSGDSPEEGGSQQGNFPMPKTYTAGVNLTF
jgi:TonB-linked SusC/RagA family outer membrane protein